MKGLVSGQKVDDGHRPDQRRPRKHRHSSRTSGGGTLATSPSLSGSFRERKTPVPQSISAGLTQDHVLRTLADLDAGIVHPFGQPTGYELLHQGKRYAP